MVCVCACVYKNFSKQRLLLCHPPSFPCLLQGRSNPHLPPPFHPGKPLGRRGEKRRLKPAAIPRPEAAVQVEVQTVPPVTGQIGCHCVSTEGPCSRSSWEVLDSGRLEHAFIDPLTSGTPWRPDPNCHLWDCAPEYPWCPTSQEMCASLECAHHELKPGLSWLRVAVGCQPWFCFGACFPRVLAF